MKDNRSVFIYDNIPRIAAHGGVARYFRHISEGLIAHFGSELSIFSPKYQDCHPSRFIRALPTNFRGSTRLGVIQLNNIIASQMAKYLSAKVFFSPYYGNIHTSAFQVFTIHDMIHELMFPKTKTSQTFIDVKRGCMERATLLIAVSKNTANDIVTCYPQINPQKIISIPLGVDGFFFGEGHSVDTVEKPYFLYVGARKGYKNFIRLIDAFGQSNLAKDFNLRVISPDKKEKFDNDEIALLHQYNLLNSVDLRLAVSESELRSSYAGAVAFVYPSEYEGFGLPVLEAMAAGTCIAASNAASIPEISGNIPYFFEPLSVDSMIEVLRSIAFLPNEERSTRIKQGISHAQNYTWARCQGLTIEAINRLLL